MLSFLISKQNKNLVEVDIHSHLIPAIDDGAKDINRSIELILELKEMGYKKLITTPHVSDMFLNSSQKIIESYRKLQEILIEKRIDIEIEVAAEYYADTNFEKLLSNNDLLSFGEKNYLLFELSYFTPPRDLESLIYDIQLAGYSPVLAHPERYIYFHNNIEKYKEIKSMGVYFQINQNSIVNHYSNEVTKTVKELITEGMVDFIGTDTHHKRHIELLKKSLSTKIYKKIFKQNNILNNSL